MEIRFDNAVNLPPITIYEGQQDEFILDFSLTPVILTPPFFGKVAYDPNGYQPAGDCTVSVVGNDLITKLPVLQAGKYYFDIISEFNGVLVKGTIEAKPKISSLP